MAGESDRARVFKIPNPSARWRSQRGFGMTHPDQFIPSARRARGILFLIEQDSSVASLLRNDTRAALILIHGGRRARRARLRSEWLSGMIPV